MPDNGASLQSSMRSGVTQELLMRGQELVRFLRFHRETQWSAWLEARLADIRAGKPVAVRNLLEGFTGIANIGDLFICREAGHRLTPAGEASVNEQFLVMVSKLYQLARDARDVRERFVASC